MIDVDHFKEINDTYGHLAGDRTLTELAGILKKVFRHSDETARIGGDEFAVFFKSIGSADIAAEKARQICRELNEFIPAKNAKPVTASIGISIVSRQGHTWTYLYEKADAALYHAKDAGRNCYQFCPDSPDTAAR